MNAARLRAAAKVLRERAEVAPPGPWYTLPGSDGDPANGPTTYTLATATKDTATGGYVAHDGCALDYAATVHPGVGLALADWLDDCAAFYETGPRPVWSDDHAERVADLILGSES